MWLQNWSGREKDALAPNLCFGWVSSESWQIPSLDWKQDMLFLPLSLYVRTKCGSVCSLYRGTPKNSCVHCGRFLRDLKATLHVLQAPETWPRFMWESSYGTLYNNSSSRNETQRSLIWAGCNPSAQSLARKWNMPFLRTNTVSLIAKQLLCMPCPWNESRIGHWCQSSPAALKQQPGLEAGHMPCLVWHCPGHCRSACKHRDFSCMSRKQTSLQKPMRMQRKSAQQKWPK